MRSALLWTAVGAWAFEVILTIGFIAVDPAKDVIAGVVWGFVVIIATLTTYASATRLGSRAPGGPVERGSLSPNFVFVVAIAQTAVTVATSITVGSFSAASVCALGVAVALAAAGGFWRLARR